MERWQPARASTSCWEARRTFRQEPASRATIRRKSRAVSSCVVTFATTLVSLRAISRLVVDGDRWIVRGFNDTGHLATLVTDDPVGDAASVASPGTVGPSA